MLSHKELRHIHKVLFPSARYIYSKNERLVVGYSALVAVLNIFSTEGAIQRHRQYSK